MNPSEQFKVFTGLGLLTFFYFNHSKLMNTTSLRTLCVTAMIALCSITMLAQLNGTGFYRFRNAQNSSQYISIANDKFNFQVCIGEACGGLSQALTNAGKARAMECAGKYLSTDIHMIEDPDIVDLGSVVYALKKNTNTSNYEYNLIGQGTSLLTLTTGLYDGSYDLLFKERYVTISKVSGSGAGALYTASIELKSATSVPLFGYPSLGIRYLVDDNGTLVINESSSAQNAKWYVEPVDHFNVAPEVELNGRYYTTMRAPFAAQLSGQVLRAYAITGTPDGILQYQEIATTGGMVPAGTPVLLECASPNAADCQLIPKNLPIFSAPDESVTNAYAPVADETTTNYTGTNLLKGTYYCNTDGVITFTKASGTGSFNADKNTKATNPQKYVIGLDESGKLGFVQATGTYMPANKAWLETGGLFPTVATPVIEPASGTYNEAKTVTITAEEGATIHYTVDGTIPTASSPVYSEPFTVSETTTVKAIAMKEGLFNNSDVATAEYVIESSVTHYKPGDVNHDNKVDIDDVTMLIDSVLGKPSGICEVCADLDGNSKVDIDDVTAAITIVLTGSY